MKKILFFVFLTVYIQAASLDDVIQWYKAKEYKKVCSSEVKYRLYPKHQNDENFVNMFASSCLKTDMINRLSIPITHLRKTKKSRANALYYTTVLYQKKLLHHAVIDGLDTIPSDIPTTEYILSRVYDMYARKEYIKEDDTFIFFDKKYSKTYKMYIKNDSDGFTKLAIESYKDGQMIKTRLYW